MSAQIIQKWASVCIKLLQGPLYRSDIKDEYWQLLITYKLTIQDYFAAIGISVYINEADGYAFLQQTEDDSPEDSEDVLGSFDETAGNLPRLIRKIPLGYELTLLCVLLREALDAFDFSQSDSSILILRESEIRDTLRVFVKEKNDQIKFEKNFSAYLSKLEELTFIKQLTAEKSTSSSNDNAVDREFEIRKIIQAKITPDFLTEFKIKLENTAAEKAQEQNNEHSGEYT